MCRNIRCDIFLCLRSLRVESKQRLIEGDLTETVHSSRSSQGHQEASKLLRPDSEVIINDTNRAFEQVNNNQPTGTSMSPGLEGSVFFISILKNKKIQKYMLFL